MAEKSKMICPRCGVEMNHHADKLIQAGELQESATGEGDGVVAEFHSCPKCGEGACRRG
jgi:ribosomal protein S27AE